jgi:hypothetical protein
MNLSIDTEKPFDKIQNLFMVTALNKLGIKGNFLNIIKTTYDKLIANITQNGKLKPFLLKSRTKQECLLCKLSMYYYSL